MVVFSNKSAVFNKYVKSEGASHYLTNQNIRSDKNIYFGVTVPIERSCIFVLVVSILPLYAIFLLDLEIFGQCECFFFFFHFITQMTSE